MKPFRSGCLLIIAGSFLAGCSTAPKEASAPRPALEPKITQLYSPNPTAPSGDAAKICYGVENAKSVWISPPQQELSVALARCIEVTPQKRTTYTLTAEGGDGKRVSQDITIGVGPKIVNVNISAVEVKPGEQVTICYTVEHAASVSIDPPGYHGGAERKGCATHRPMKSTTYVVLARSPEGETDEEKVTVNVR